MSARDATLALLTARADEASVCPSEVARALAGDGPAADWRAEMAGAHAAVDQLMVEGQINLSWKGEALTKRAGPYRIRRGTRGSE
ncbi:MAG: DUF3253 domain-containing protein [Pseudomonadota bacterium]